MTITPYVRLGAFYFFFFGSLGAFVPYWSLYLDHLSFAPQEIGALSAILLATKIVAPNVWGWIADHTGKRISIIRIATFLGLVIFSFALVAREFWPMVFTLIGFSFFWNAALPQFEVATFTQLGDNKHFYSRIRLWGSVGFILVAMSLAPILDRFGIQLLPIVILILLFGIWINTLFVREVSTSLVDTDGMRFFTVCKQPMVIALLVASFFIQASHGPYYAFFSIYLEQHGYTRNLIGQLWSLGVVAEIFVFLMMYRWLPRFGAAKLLIVAMALTVLRWWAIVGFVDNFAAIFLAQLLHAASFGLFHSAAIYLIDRYFVGGTQGRGQALYSSVGFGLGGALGSLLSGYIWLWFGPSWVYIFAAFSATVALVQYFIFTLSHQYHRV